MKWLAYVVSAVVLAVIIAAFVTVGGPAKQRSLKFDQQRINDLSSIQYQIQSYWSSKGTLPANLAELKSSISGFTAPTDPETIAEYEYHKNSDLGFQLCATFNLASEQNTPKLSPYPYDSVNSNWDHTAGRQCFDRLFDPQRDNLYPKTPPVK